MYTITHNSLVSKAVFVLYTPTVIFMIIMNHFETEVLIVLEFVIFNLFANNLIHHVTCTIITMQYISQRCVYVVLTLNCFQSDKIPIQNTLANLSQSVGTHINVLNVVVWSGTVRKPTGKHCFFDTFCTLFRNLIIMHKCNVLTLSDYIKKEKNNELHF